MDNYKNYKYNGEYYISEIHYSKYGNYLCDNDEFFTIQSLSNE
jgi:hypothetical protein